MTKAAELRQLGNLLDVDSNDINLGSYSDSGVNRTLRFRGSGNPAQKIEFREVSGNYGFTIRYSGDTSSNQFHILRHENDGTGVEAITLARSGGQVVIGGAAETDFSATGVNSHIVLKGGFVRLDEDEYLLFGNGANRPGIAGNKTSAAANATSELFITGGGADRWAFDGNGYFYNDPSTDAYNSTPSAPIHLFSKQTTTEITPLIKLDWGRTSTTTVYRNNFIGLNDADELILAADESTNGTDSAVIIRVDATESLKVTPQWMKIPVGTTAQRPSIGRLQGMTRFNTDLNSIEYWDGSGWYVVAKETRISRVSLPANQSAANIGDTIRVYGKNFASGDVIKFRYTGGASTYTATTTFVSSDLLTCPIPTLGGEGTYDILVNNSNGDQAVLIGAIDIDGVAVFNTPSGSLGSYSNGTDTVNLDVGATEDGVVVNIIITSGSLPAGLSISNAGIITGTPNTTDISDTTYSFTVTATDSEGQTTTRDYTITIADAYEMSGSTMFEGQS